VSPFKISYFLNINHHHCCLS